MKECLGCCTSFKEGEKLKYEEGLNIEFKNYNLPIQENKGKRTLLKTIVSFLNSQGGNIYIAVQDTKGTVKGAELYEKDKKEFQQFIDALTQHIRPPIDLLNDPKISVQFVPVISKKGFENKYVPKIIVKQGDPSKIYYFMHQLKIQTENQCQNHDVLYSYVRHNMGGIQELKGLPLLKEIRNRAITPQIAVNETHQCNPQPPIPEEAPGTVAILDVSQDEKQSLELYFSENLAELGVVFKANYRAERQTLFFNFQQSSQFEKTKNILKESLDYLSDEHPKYAFKIQNDQKKEVTIILKDKFKTVKKETEEKPRREENKIQPEEMKVKKEEKATSLKKKESPMKEQKEKKELPEKKRREISREGQEEEKEKKSFNQKKPKNEYGFTKRHGITFTHLDPSKIKELAKYVQDLFPNVPMNRSEFVNSLEVFVSNNEEKEALQLVLFERRREFKEFGFKQNYPIWGRNEKTIVLKNYDKNKRQDMKTYLMTLMKGDIVDINFQNITKGTYVSVIYFVNPERACFWLDRLLTNYELKEKFGIPGSKDGRSAKMKCILVLKNRFCQELENSNDYYV